MKGNTEKASGIVRLSACIVDKRNILFVVYLAAFVFSLFAQNWVEVCNDITAYLPHNTETRQGLQIMEDEFVTYATSDVMAVNVTYEQAATLCEAVEALPCVDMVDFDDTEEHYKNGSALLHITLTSEAGDSQTDAGYAAIREAAAGYDTYISESASDSSAELEQEMTMALAIAAIIIIAVLLLTSHAYMEVPVLLLTFVAAAIINKGTNFIFGEISFVSNSVTAILQLALSIDYAIILIHHYGEERQSYEQREAVVYALAKSIPEISSSSLTTISGLMALMFMQFRIGFDLGLCLIKAILFSLLCVFTLMPGLLMLLGKYIDKTHHKNFVPNISRLGNVVHRLRVIVPPIFLVVLVVAYLFSSKCPFVYDQASSETDRKNETQIAKEQIAESFGSENIAALLVPVGDYEKEKQLVRELESDQRIASITALSNITAKEDYVLTDRLTPRQFAELTDIDIELADVLYMVYAADHEDYSKLAAGNLGEFGVPLIDMFLFVYDLKQDGYVKFDEPMASDLDDLYRQLDSARKQLSGEHYSRILLDLNLPVEGEETFAYIDELHQTVAKYYSVAYVAGNSTSSYDLQKSFARDNVIVNVLSVLFVILVLFFTFKSAGLPVLLIAVIQGSVWLNFSTPYLHHKPLFFMSYLIVSSIQMGANIDYAIVISSRYLELKQGMHVKRAMRRTLNFAFPTVLTSGSILSAAGFLIGKLSTDPTVVSIGQSLCRGTLISMFLVMCVLPEILLLGDLLVEKTKFEIKKPEIVRKERGKFLVNGRMRGYVNGFVDAEIHGLIVGDMEAQIQSARIEKVTEELEDGTHKSEQ